MIKLDIQELWRFYSINNDIIVFHANQTEKHYEKYHEKFHKKHYEMNLKCKIQWHPLFLIFWKVIYFKNNLIWPFQLLVPRLYSFLYLVSSRGQHSPRYVPLLWDVFFSNVLPYRLFQLYSTRVDGFSFLSIYGQPYLTFLFPLLPLICHKINKSKQINQDKQHMMAQFFLMRKKMTLH